MLLVIDKSYRVKRSKSKGEMKIVIKKIYSFSDPVCAKVSACSDMFFGLVEFIFFSASRSNF